MKEEHVSQVNVNQPDPDDRSTDRGGAGTVATKNLTWALAAVIVIAAIVFAILYLVQNLHP